MASNDKKDPLANLVDKLRSFFGLDNPPKNKTASAGKRGFKLWYFIFAMILFSYLQPLLFSPKTETIPYGQFKQYVAEGVAGELIIGPENINGVLAGSPQRKFTTVRVNDPDLVRHLDENIVAFHESGHAIVAESVAHADPVHKISIIPRGIAALGYTQQQPTEDRYLLTRSELNDRLAVLLGGRVAEELAFDEISTGAQNDLQRASDIARAMVTEYGMSDLLGLVSYERPRQPMFLPESFSQGKHYSEAKAAQIDEEVTRFVDEAHQRVRKILSQRRSVLDDLAHLLSQKESVQGEELRRMLAAAGAPASFVGPNESNASTASMVMNMDLQDQTREDSHEA
jgi:ATP-dependent Zn protease